MNLCDRKSYKYLCNLELKTSPQLNRKSYPPLKSTSISYKVVSEPQILETMAKTNMIPFQVPKLSKEKLDNWCIRMKALLGAHDAWDIVENGYEAPTDLVALTKAQKDLLQSTKREDQKAVSIIHQALDEITFKKVSNATTTNQLWDMRVACKGKETVKKVRLQNLQGEFEAIQMKKFKNPSDYISRVVTVANQMKRLDEDVTDLRVIEKIPRSVSEKFDHVVTAIEESKDVEDMTIEELSGSLKGKYKFQRTRVWMRLWKRRKSGDGAKANLSHEEDIENNEEIESTFLIACKDLQQGEKHSWFPNIEASNHMCVNKYLFIEHDEKVGGNITFGDFSKIPIRGKGKILVHMKDRNHKFISNVYYALDMKSNILSVGQLLEKGYVLFTKGCSMFLKDDVENLIAKVPMAKNRLFVLSIQTDMAKCLTPCYKDSLWL
ncbi:uncharacterized protein LOC111380967 [Olea europaea var. sylvestris]|uniref:uncharacterized protein LOC111380967 n=1 Tax=Olea europaea var. sylvestris TaxID=158386 RepID=UPI000C1CFDBE|nr:uncharacterized protein LOC111380967 [Olea europaea var. sylvestris]